MIDIFFFYSVNKYYTAEDSCNFSDRQNHSLDHKQEMPLKLSLCLFGKEY